jgi:hypothetical protein
MVYFAPLLSQLMAILTLDANASRALSESHLAFKNIDVEAGMG